MMKNSIKGRTKDIIAEKSDFSHRQRMIRFDSFMTPFYKYLLSPISTFAPNSLKNATYIHYFIDLSLEFTYEAR